MKPIVLMLIMSCFLGITACNSSKKTMEEMPTEKKMNKGDTGFLLKGNEPFWNVVISAQEITLRQMGEDAIVYPYYSPKDGASSQIFESKTSVKGKTSSLKIIVEQKKCDDTMADMSYDYKATVIKDGKTMRGCGSKK